MLQVVTDKIGPTMAVLSLDIRRNIQVSPSVYIILLFIIYFGESIEINKIFKILLSDKCYRATCNLIEFMQILY